MGNMHLYKCLNEGCLCTFAVEDNDNIEQSVIVCPHCEYSNIQDAGYGYFTVTKEAEAC